MTAYVISKVTMKPGPALDRYRELASASIAEHGGRYLVRGGAQTVLEGEWAEATIIVAFPSRAAAEAWYASDGYAAALEHRPDALDRDLVLVDGL